MKLKIKEQNQVTIQGITLRSCSDYHYIYEVHTKEKYPCGHAYCGHEISFVLDEHSPSYKERENMPCSYVEFEGLDDDWEVCAVFGNRYSFLAIAFKDTDESENFLVEI